jgi:HEAT repeat protein
MIQLVVLAGALAGLADPYEFVTDMDAVKSDAVTDLIKGLGGDPKKGRSAAMRLVRFGGTAVPELEKALKSESLQVRFYAASALDLIRHNSSTKALVGVLGDVNEHPIVSKIAVRAMGRDEYVPAVPQLVKLLVGDPASTTVTKKPVSAASDVGGEPKTDEPLLPPDELPRYLDTSPLAADEDFRFEVVRALAYIADRGGTGVLIEALKDPSARIREVAAQGLGDQRAAAGIAGLRKLLADPEAKAAAGAARALSKYGKTAAAATPELIDALGRPEYQVQRYAKGALAVITGFSFSSQERWREWWQEQLEKKNEPPPPEMIEPDTPRPVYDEAKTKRRPLKPGEAPPALRSHYEWDDEDWRTTSE